jgi:hypothetical protein
MPHFMLTPENLAHFCERQNFQFQQTEQGQIAVLYQIMGQPSPLQMLPWPDRNMVTLAVTLPFTVPNERFSAVSEALTAANSMSFMGTWVLNTDNGQIYFRDTLATLDNQYSDDGLLFVARIVVSSAERLAPLFYRVAIEGAPASSVEQALRI